MAGLSSISGLVAGFDTKGAVDELLGVRKLEISQLEKKQEKEIARQDAFTELNNLLLNFRNVSNSMKDAGSFFSYTANLTSNNASVPASSLLDVSGDDSVSPGNHTIVVRQLAQAERLSSSAAIQDALGAAVASASTSLGISGTFQVNGTSITVNAANSLDDIVALINKENAATNVSASVIKVADNDFRLVLAADETGAAGFTLSGADLDAGGTLGSLQLGATGQTNARSVLQAAQDAQLDIDGLTISRSSNTIGDALKGLTFTLRQADIATTVNMSIGVDRAGVRLQVQSFIDAYNEISTFINDQFTFDAASESNGVLSGEALLTSIQGQLSSMLLQTVSGLASDRDSLVEIGIEPDVKGQLQINETLFSNFLNNDVNAIRDIFAATGNSSNPDLQFLVPGYSSPSGIYSVDITTVAQQASVTGTTDLSAGLAADQTVTLTETGNARQAVVNLTAGESLSQIINALNTEFTTVFTEQHQLSSALTISGGAPANSGNSFADLGLGIAAGDTVSISGTNRSGVAVNSTFTVLDPATDTIADLLSSIQSAFNQGVLASLDTNGYLLLTDKQSGDSQLTVNITANNEGGGTLDFGVDTIVTEGRYAMALEAVASGNAITIQHKNFGASKGFSISQSSDGLGIADQSVAGVDVAGTINGEAVTGSGQMLTGTSGNVDGMSLLYTGSVTGSVGSITLGMGAAAVLENKLDLFANPFTGLIQNTITSSQDTYNSLGRRIEDLNLQLEKQRVILTNAFTLMEQSLATLQSSGNFLTQQIDAMNAARK